MIQVRQITSLVYNQQARYFINEAEEVVRMYENTEKSAINERLDILAKFLSANTAIMDTTGNILYGQTAIDQSTNKILLEPSFKEKVLSDKKVVFAGKIAGENEEMFLVAVPLKKIPVPAFLRKNSKIFGKGFIRSINPDRGVAPEQA